MPLGSEEPVRGLAASLTFLPAEDPEEGCAEPGWAAEPEISL